MGRPFPLQNCPFPWWIWTPSNTWFPGPTQVLNPNGISIGSAVLAGLTSVTDRQTDQQKDRPTDHATLSVTIDRIYVRNAAMRYKMERRHPVEGSFSNEFPSICNHCGIMAA